MKLLKGVLLITLLYLPFVYGGQEGEHEVNRMRTVYSRTYSIGQNKYKTVYSTTPFDFINGNGQTWEFQRMATPETGNDISYLSPNDIWGTSVFPVHWDGNNWTLYQLQNMGMNADAEYLWAFNASSIYFCGQNGSFVHYSNGGFYQINTNTDIDLIDITGNSDGAVLVAGNNGGFGTNGSILLMLKENRLYQLYKMTDFYQSEYGYVYCVDYDGEEFLIGTTNGLVKYNDGSDTFMLIPSDTMNIAGNFAINSVKSQASNDVAVVSNWGQLTFFNGCGWHSDPGINSFINTDGTFYVRAMSYKNDVLAVVGKDITNNRAVIVYGSNAR